jgi:hypothetical protein
MIESGLTRAVVSAVLSGLLMLGTASAADYDPPAGFNGHAWGEPLSASPALVLWQANKATGYAGKVTEFQMRCTPEGNSCNYLQAEMVQRVEGAGTYALAEYYLRSDTNPWQGAGVGLIGVTYMYCASGVGNHLPTPLRKNLGLCGARAYFTSDTDELKAQLGADHQSNLDRLLRKLVAEHGMPPGYKPRGSITIDALEPDGAALPAPAGGEQLRAWRWCGLKEAGSSLTPPCPATLTLVFDGSKGTGMLLYATPPMYAYAWARHEMGDAENELFVLLSGQIKAPVKRDKIRQCTGSRNCGTSNTGLSAKSLAEFQP